MSSIEPVKPRFEVISEPGAAIEVTQVNLTEEEEKGLSVNVRLPALPRKPDQSRLKRTLVRFAEWAGWLNKVPKSDVDEYLRRQTKEAKKFMNLFCHDLTTEVFEDIAKNRNLTLRQIEFRHPKKSRNQIVDCLRRLKEANCVGVIKNEHFDDFDTYHLTAIGLKAARDLDRLSGM